MFKGYYFNIKDPQWGIIAGTVENPTEIENRLQEWQKTDSVTALINEKYGSQEKRAAQQATSDAGLDHLKALDVDGIQQGIENSANIEDLKTTLLELCEALRSVKAIITGE